MDHLFNLYDMNASWSLQKEIKVNRSSRKVLVKHFKVIHIVYIRDIVLHTYITWLMSLTANR